MLKLKALGLITGFVFFDAGYGSTGERVRTEGEVKFGIPPALLDSALFSPSVKIRASLGPDLEAGRMVDSTRVVGL